MCICVGEAHSHMCGGLRLTLVASLTASTLLMETGSLRQSGQTACSWDPVSTFRLLGLEASHHSHLAVAWVLGSKTLVLKFLEQMIFLLNPIFSAQQKGFLTPPTPNIHPCPSLNFKHLTSKDVRHGK